MINPKSKDSIRTEIGATKFYNRKDTLWLKENFPELWSWLESISRFGRVEDFCIIQKCERGVVKIIIATNDHTYTISAHRPRNDHDKGYLGCISLTRKPKFGEDWTRGNDLHDGSYCIETWNGIMGDIISYELEKSVFAKPTRGV